METIKDIARNHGWNENIRETPQQYIKELLNEKCIMRREIPYRCPVCNGTGMVSFPPDIPGDLHYTTTEIKNYSCRSCNASGVIWR